jgi:hypothetical protein
MSLNRVNPETYQAIDFKDDLEVKQGARNTLFLAPEENAPNRLYTKGLNPCIGIVLYGEIQTENNDEDPTYFAFFHHYEGLTELEAKKAKEKSGVEKKEIINNICQQEIIKALSAVEEAGSSDDEKITSFKLSKSFIMFCGQDEDKKNEAEKASAILQNETSSALKEVLNSKEKLQEITLKENDAFSSSLSFDDEYKLEFLEIKQATNEENYSMDCYIGINEDGELNVSYCYAPPNVLKEAAPFDEEGSPKKLEKDIKESTGKPMIKRNLQSSESNSSSFSQNSSQSIYSDSGSTLFSSSSSSLSSSTSNPTSTQKDEINPSKRQRLDGP